ncbi:5'-AMP-activated protein kinase subunit beta-2 [Choanephora cucurbitarum]|uniref:5'-AMP-activated protein kinase subunit beta-2 n=1 Tax=Choanephora cucurbitarum TaxID=101091 RepID=A0A1C7NPP1_9FUNG|nr:5'-AMP-activated protein kinase subunit beta-2 [Choanephora cucurbitarum]
MGNTNSTEASQHADMPIQDNNTDDINKSTQEKANPPTQLTTHSTHDPVSPTAIIHSPLPSIEEDKVAVPQIIEPTKAVPVSTGKKSGWVSSTGGASPWYGSLSSSASSSHRRASISGPYYRTRGMSITRDSENDEDYPHIQTQSTFEPNDLSKPSTLQPQPQSQQQPQQQPQPQPQPQQQQQQPQLQQQQQQQGVPTIITWSQGGHQVYVTGTFNGWKHKIKLVKSTHDFSAIIELPPGTHRLKFIVDDEWKCSNEMETATDPDGNLVNYLQVLDDDEEDADEFGDHETTTVSSSSLPDDYTSVIPPELLQLASLSQEQEEQQQQEEEHQQQQQQEEKHRKKILMEWEKKQPPGLPPHLEKVLLNSTTVSEEDNSVLHEPNHVTLNHLYACSIKDNVMALATTSRYRKKYVTTMYYRPVMGKE